MSAFTLSTETSATSLLTALGDGFGYRFCAIRRASTRATRTRRPLGVACGEIRQVLMECGRGDEWVHQAHLDVVTHRTD